MLKVGQQIRSKEKPIERWVIIDRRRKDGWTRYKIKPLFLGNTGTRWIYEDNLAWFEVIT